MPETKAADHAKEMREEASPLLVQFSFRYPYFIAVCVLALVALGLVMLFGLPTDLLPTFKTPAIQVLTFYPGMPTDVIERDMTSRLERWTGQANGIVRQESKSILGVSILRDYFRSDIDPNTAMSQVTSLAMSDLYYLPPGTIPPMVMPFDPTAVVPLVLLSVSSLDKGEKELYDIAYFSLRNRLQGIPGVIAPAVYGGKLRRILAYVDPKKLAEFNLSPLDVVDALNWNNVLIPTGYLKSGDFNYQINTRGIVQKVEEMNDFPIRAEEGTTVLVKDVAQVKDSHQIQSNIVRINGRRQVYIPVYRQPGANTVAVVDAMRQAINGILERLPKGINLDLVADQSQYIRKAITNLSFEAIFGSLLAAIMILLFLHSYLSAGMIFITLPLSILFAIIGLFATNETINIMTLGGLSLAIGRLMDDPIVVLENITRHLAMGKSRLQASLHGASEVVAPVFAATMVNVIIIIPTLFLTGISRFLFVPMAASVSFAVFGSFLASMALTPLLASRFLRSSPQQANAATRFDRFFNRIKKQYIKLLGQCLRHRVGFLSIALILFILSWGLFKFLGTELLPPADVGHIKIQVRAPTGTRIEKTEELIIKVEKAIQEVIPQKEIRTLISNMGVLNDWPAAYTSNSGDFDAFIEIQLDEKRQSKSIFAYTNQLRQKLNSDFKDAEFSFDTGGMLTAALSGGLPSPINIQVEGNDLQRAHEIAEKAVAEIKKVRGAVDVKIQQRLNYPQIEIVIDRIKAKAMRLTAEDIVKNIVTASNSSINFKPSFWIDEKNGNHYFLGAQYPEEILQSLEILKEIPIRSKTQERVVPLKELVTFKQNTAPSEIAHLNISRVTDIYVNVMNRDVGSVASDIEKLTKKIEVPAGYFIHVRGEITQMKSSFKGLGFGFLLSVFLVYLVLVAQFRSFSDPLIILVSVPLGLIGVWLILFLTGNTLNIQSGIGTIFMIGVAVSNAILLVEFTNRARHIPGRSVHEALLEAGAIRLRPILMISLAAILGLVPMALGLGRGTEANVPLALAVIGGLSVSTVMTLFVIPSLYAVFHKN